MNATGKPLLTLTLNNIDDHVGQELGVSDWLLVEQELVERFAELTGDDNWIHVDRKRAARELGGTIAHGLLVLSLIPRMRRDIYRIVGVGMALNYGHDRLRFTGTTPVGSRIRLRMSLSAIAPQGEGRRVTFSLTIEREGAERPSLVADWIIILYPKTMKRG